MKILILGTSNSLRRGGWVTGLIEALPDAEVRNMSIGASPGLQYALLMDMDFSYYDYVVFDSVPNDEEYFYRTVNYSNQDFFNDIYYEMFSTISSQSRLIVLAIPLFTHFKEASGIFQTRELLARSAGAQFLCFRSIIENMHSLMDSIIDGFYDSQQHPTLFISNFIGKQIARVLNDDYANGGMVFIHDTRNFARNFVKRDLAKEYSPDKVYQVSNSLMAWNYVLLGQGDEITIDNTSLLIGFYVNVMKTKTHLDFIHNESKIATVSLMREPSDNGSFLKVFIPSPLNASCIDHIRLTGEVDGESSVPIIYRTDIAEQKTDDPLLSISELCMWNPSGVKFIDCVKNYNYDHCMITRQVNININNMYMSMDKSYPLSTSVHSFHGYAIAYDRMLCECVVLDKKLEKIYPGQLFPVHVNMSDDQGHFVVNIDGMDIELTCFAKGIGLSADHPLRTNRRFTLGESFGNTFTVINTLELLSSGKTVTYSSFKIDDIYMRCYKMRTTPMLAFNSRQIAAWEKFRLP